MTRSLVIVPGMTHPITVYSDDGAKAGSSHKTVERPTPGIDVHVRPRITRRNTVQKKARTAEFQATVDRFARDSFVFVPEQVQRQLLDDVDSVKFEKRLAVLPAKPDHTVKAIMAKIAAGMKRNWKRSQVRKTEVVNICRNMLSTETYILKNN
jgi:hypothetical protein